MELRETPYIKINEKTGQIDYTSAYIKEYLNDDNIYAISYNTVIGIYTRDETGRKIYLETARVYSQTTATKHKPRAAAIAAHNNYKIITDINPDILRDIYGNPDKANITEILNESEERKQLLNELQTRTKGKYYYHLKFKGLIKARKKPTRKNYKNGNRQTKYYYTTKFKTVSNIYFEVNHKTITTTIKRGNSKPGKAKTGSKYNIYKDTIVNITRW